MDSEKEPMLKTTPSLLQLTWAFFIIGLTAYSAAMLQQLKHLL